MISTVYSQIVYTDVVPDIVYPLAQDDSWGIDIDNDGTDDYNFEVVFSDLHINSVVVENEVVCDPDYFVAVVISSGDPINEGSIWKSGTDYPFLGDFAGQGDKYIGIRFSIGSNIHYGWILINHITGSLTMKSYAYESTPNTAINAGDNGGSTAVLVTSVTVQGQGGTSTITTEAGTLQMEAEVLPANADNPTITWSVTDQTGSASIDSDGLLTAINNGTVTVTATANDGSGVLGSTVITISNQVSVSEVLAKSLSIYPNPFSNYITIDSKLVSEFQTMTIYSSDGKIVQNSTLDISTAKYFNLSELDNGIYLLALTTKKGNIIFKKLIKIS